MPSGSYDTLSLRECRWQHAHARPIITRPAPSSTSPITPSVIPSRAGGGGGGGGGGRGGGGGCGALGSLGCGRLQLLHARAQLTNLLFQLNDLDSAALTPSNLSRAAAC